jgi:hypothetical protein
MEAQEGKGMTDEEIDQVLSGLKRKNSFMDEGVFPIKKLYIAKENPSPSSKTINIVPQTNEEIIDFAVEEMSAVISG